VASPWSGKRGPALSGPVVGASGLLLAGMFAVSGVRKAVARRETADMLVELGMPRRLGPAASVLLPAAELATAGGLLFTGSAPWGAAAACGLLAVFTVAIAVNLAAGRRPTCRCFGRQAAAVGWRTLLRNGSLLVVAGLVAWSGWREPAPTLTAWLGRLSAGQAAALLGAAAAVGVVVLQTRAILDLVAQHGRLLVRLEAVEGALLGQPLGGSAPEFVASDGAGQPVTLAALRARGRPILLVFVEPDCRACDGVVTDTARWRRDYGNLLTVALVDLKGDGADAGDRIVPQRGEEMARAYGVRGTPSAVAIAADGRILASRAEGAEAILALVSQIVGAGRGGPVPAGDLRAMADGQRNGATR